MFQKISDRIQLPMWCKGAPRYRILEMRDRLLDGTFYNHLNYAFYDEKTQAGTLVPLDERRPSAQFRLPRMVSRWCARKLYAGRHRPKLRHEDKKAVLPLIGLLSRGKFMQTMSEAALLGSVGSIAVTFRVEGTGDDADVALQIWRAKYCQPSFDQMGNLSQLRVAYTTSAAALKALGEGAGDLEDGAEYWWIRDYLPDDEVTYLPVKKDEWNPVEGFVGAKGAETRTLQKWAALCVAHGLGFVPGHWFVNLSGGMAPDGACTWQDAIPNSIELDYTLSQVGRGTRYNCAPQPVIIGKMLNDGSMTRSPMEYIHLAGGWRDEDGSVVEGGDAKLLEMSGTGITAALSLIDHLRNFALEQIAASRKDPDKMKAPLSGRAMEYLDEDTSDLIMDLRGQYGEDGALPLIKKIALAAKVVPDKIVAALSLQWPRLFQPTPDEVFALVQAFVLALDPMKRSQPATPGRPAGATGAPAVPAQAAQAPGDDEQLLTVAEARAYLLLNLDMAMLDVDADTDDQSADASPTPPGQPTPPVPPPSPIDVPPSEGEQQPVPENSAAGNAGPMTVGPSVRVNA